MNKKTLLSCFRALLLAAILAFPQERTSERVWKIAHGAIASWGRRTISRALCACGCQFEDWSADYRVFSRSPWETHDFFQPVFVKSLIYCRSSGPVVIAMDDTTLKKTGKKIPGVSYARDPMSPPFHVNLMQGQRFIQASVIIRPEELEGPARAIPIRFEPAPPPAKPGKRADDAAIQRYKEAKKTENLSCQGARLINDIWQSAQSIPGVIERGILLAVDGSYCNRNVLRNLPDGVHVVARSRSNITLYSLPENNPPRGRKRKYGDKLPKPDAIRTNDEQYPWHTAPIYGAGRIHQVRYKCLNHVLWKTGTRDKPLRLIIIAALRYKLTPKGRFLYRDPAYLLSTDNKSSVETLIQAAFDRWEIEVNHRDEKSLLGVGQAQVWSEESAERYPQFQVALYSMLMLASLDAYGPKRTSAYLRLPKWRKGSPKRPSTLDMIALFREELFAAAIDESTPGDYVQRAYLNPRDEATLSPTRTKFHAGLINAALYAST